MDKRCSVVLLEIVVFFIEQCFTSLCDMERGIILDDGNMGPSSDFNWLGLFIVYLQDLDDVEEAATGIVLVKPKYAIANANDIAKIPRQIFLDSKAMFIADGDVPVYYKPLSYVTHPEYETAIYSTLAIIKLAVPPDSLLVPICFPEISYDSDHLYLFGYTEDNNIMEKVIYKIESMETCDCDQFYEKEGLVDRHHKPPSYVCGWHRYSNGSCVWNNGMVLASNTTGWFTFIGFSVHGPGCKVPARFIFMLHYFSWIHSETRDESARRTDIGYRREVPLDNIRVEYVPSGKYSLVGILFQHEYVKWPNYQETSGSNDSVKMKYFSLEPSYEDPHTIAIYPFDTKQEMYWKACETRRALRYREQFELTAPSMLGVVTYKLSMYDLNIPTCSCVELTVKCTRRSEAYLTLRDEINFTPEDSSGGEGGGGGGGGGGSGPTVGDGFTLIKVSDGAPSSANATGNGTDDNPLDKPNKQVEYLHGDVPSGKVISYDLYIRLEFQGSAVLKFQIFGEPADIESHSVGPIKNLEIEIRGVASIHPHRPGYQGPPVTGRVEIDNSGKADQVAPLYEGPRPGQNEPIGLWTGDINYLLEKMKPRHTTRRPFNMDYYGNYRNYHLRSGPDGGNLAKYPDYEDIDGPRINVHEKTQSLYDYDGYEQHQGKKNIYPDNHDARRTEQHFWGISQHLVDNSVKRPSLVVVDLEQDTVSAGRRIGLVTRLVPACCIILLLLFI